MNTDRGLHKALIFGGGGFLVTTVALGVIAVGVLTLSDVHPIDRAHDIQRLPFTILQPAIGCAFVFALAGFAAYAPRFGVEYFRALAVVGAAVVLAMCAVQTRPRNKLADPNAWLEVAVPVAAGLIATAALTVFGERINRPSHTEVTKGIEQ